MLDSHQRPTPMSVPFARSATWALRGGPEADRDKQPVEVHLIQSQRLRQRVAGIVALILVLPR